MLSAVQILLMWGLATSLACAAQSDSTGVFVSPTALGPGDGSECAPFASIDSAVATALAAGGGTIHVLGNTTDRLELRETEIFAPVSIMRRGSSIVVMGRVDIRQPGLLEIQGLSVQMGRDTGGGLIVEGQLIITNSTVAGFDSAIEIVGGAVILENTTVMDCVHVVSISSPHAFLNASQVTFQNNRGTLILVSDGSAQSQVQLLVLSCLFHNNSGEGLIFLQTKNQFSAVSIDARACLFLSNSGQLFVILGFNFNASIDYCSFANNRNGAIHVEATNAVLTLANCDWRKHGGKVVEVLLLVGQLELANATFKEQSSDSPIFIANTGDATNCFFSLSNATYADSNWTTARRNAGLLLLSSCAASMTGVTIRNVTVAGLFGLFNGLIDVERGYAEVRQLSIEHSQSNQALIYVVYSSVFIVDSCMIDVGSGLNALSILSLNTNISFIDFSISGAVGLSTSESIAVSEDLLLYFVSNLNNMLLRRVDIDAGVGEAIVGEFLGNLSAESVTIRNAVMRLGLFGTIGANSQLSGIYVKNCTADFIMTAKGKVSMYFSNVTIESIHTKKVISCGIFAQCFLSNTTISQSLYTSLAQAVDASIEITGISVQFTHMTYVLRGSANSVMRLVGAVVRDCEGVLAEAYGSHVEVAHSALENLKCGKTMIVAVQANITLREVTIRKVWSESSSLGNIQDSSILQVIDSNIKELSWSNGIIVKDSSLAVTGSSFAEFPFTLFIGKSANISLVRSCFQDGGPTDKNPLLHGGVLSCFNCDKVELTRISAKAITASQGGGIYLSNSVAAITHCSFLKCTAINGGAVAILDSKFLISDSDFTACSASGSGGAIDISSSDSDSEVAYSEFSFNAAKAGGAVNIRKTVPALRAVSFSWNTAEYGPDVASYTVAARVSSTFPTNVSYASGNPFPQNLKIEVLDHFGQIVTTDSTAQLSFILPSNIAYGGMAQAVAQKGIIDLGTAPFYAPPSSNATITSAILAFYSSTSHVFGFSWELSFRGCQLGEVEHVDRCEVCPAGKFSLSLNDSQCQLCPPNAYCPGGFKLELDKGFWRTSNVSSKLLTCPFSEQCLGGVDNQCRHGYKGKLCSECSDDWYRIGTFYCQKCSLTSAVFQVIAYYIQYIIIFFIAFYLSEVKPNDTRSAALQIWIDYCQCTSVLLRLRTEHPQMIVYLYQLLTYIGSMSASALPVSCLFVQERSPYMKMLIVSVTPVVALLSLIVLAHFRVRNVPKIGVIRLFGIMIYFAGASISESFAALLLSTKLGSGTSRWLCEDASIESWSFDHIQKVQQIYTPLFVCYVLLPLLTLTIACTACKLRKFTAAYCPFLTKGLKAKLFFAQFIIHYWKLLFILITMAVTARTQLLQIALSLLLLIVLVPTLVAMNAYSSQALLFLSVGSKVVVFCSVCAAAYFMQWSPSAPTLLYLFCPVLFGLHLLVCCFFAKVFVQGKRAPVESAVRRKSVRIAAEEVSVIAVLDPPPNSVAEWRLDSSQPALRRSSF